LTSVEFESKNLTIKRDILGEIYQILSVKILHIPNYFKREVVKYIVSILKIL
jgi:hypothetical protein